MLELLFLLLPVAAGYGWIMGRNSARKAQRKQSSILSRHYYKGLNFLFSDQPDKAVDTLIKMINIDSDTAETHIAMGNFYRQRGEIDRAIKVHQNIVERDGLVSTQHELALKELARDYTQAGFLERAESSYLQLLSSERHRDYALRQLFGIYQTTKEWLKAIQLAEKAQQEFSTHADIQERVAHFYCEQAAAELRSENLGSALNLLQSAIQSDSKAVRPWLMLGDIAFSQGRYDDAQRYYTEIAIRDSSWFSEAIPKLQKIAEETSDWVKFEAILTEHWHASATSYLAMVEVMLKRKQHDEAAEYLLEQLRKRPTMKGFKTLMGLYIDNIKAPTSAESLLILIELVEQQIEQRPKYRCVSCGFSGRKLYWLCPSCKKWGAVKPIKGLDGE